MAEYGPPEPHPYSISPESSKPRTVYIPSLRDILVPREVIVEEEFYHDGGNPVSSFPLVLRDKTETVLTSRGSEVKSRNAQMAPVFLIEDDSGAVRLPEPLLRSLYRELSHLNEWLVDEKGVYIMKNSGEEESDRFPHFYLIIDRDNTGRLRTDVYPELGETLRLEDPPELHTSRHINAGPDIAVFERLVHVHQTEEGALHPFYVGVMYHQAILQPKVLSDHMLRPVYDPISVRNLVSPFIYTKPFRP